MSSDERLLRHPRVALATYDAGCLAYHIETRQLHQLNLTAALVMELSDGTRTVADLCRDLKPLVCVEESEACAGWIETAKTNGLLLCILPDVPLPPSPGANEFSSRAEELQNEGYVLGAFVCRQHAAFLAPDDFAQWYALGELAYIVGRRDDSRDAYEKYLRLKPGDAEIEQILAALRNEPPPARAPNRCIEQIYSGFAEYYEDTMCGELAYEAPARLTEALDMVLERRELLDVLELGCGTGLAAPYLRKRARRLWAIDLSPQMANLARKKGLYDNIEIAEITEWLSRSDAAEFDLIVACDTMIYFGNLPQVIVPAARRIRRGGWLAFTVERGETSPFRLTDSGRYAHTESHIREAANAAGLSVVHLTEGFLRYEYGEPVAGLVAILQQRATGC
jgi:predicted TPR repeat methyltransferase